MAKEEVLCPKLQTRFEHFGDCNVHAVSCRFAPASIPRHLSYRAMGLWRNKRRSAPLQWERASHRRTLQARWTTQFLLYLLANATLANATILPMSKSPSFHHLAGSFEVRRLDPAKTDMAAFHEL
jgi:hypothetical protein